MDYTVSESISMNRVFIKNGKGKIVAEMRLHNKGSHHNQWIKTIETANEIIGHGNTFRNEKWNYCPISGCRLEQVNKHVRACTNSYCER